MKTETLKELDIEITKSKDIVFSAIQPTGMITIGNYLGAVKNWVSLQEDYDCFYAIADLHSLTINLKGATLRQNIVDLFAMLLACGLDSDKSTFFCQSSVAEHSQLAWVLNCITYYGEASRMTQFKDKSQKNADNINVGLFTYPVLQAADILLYNAKYVPIGLDQKQHLELSRDVAERFNNRYSPTFCVPEVLIPKIASNVWSLADPEHKMSKSDENQNAFILLTDDNDAIARKIKRAVTDSLGTIEYSKDRKGISNLIDIYSGFSDLSTEKVVEKYKTCSYEKFKSELAELVVSKLEPIRERYKKLKADREFLQQCMQKGTQKASSVARKMLSKVYRKIGLN